MVRPCKCHERGDAFHPSCLAKMVKNGRAHCFLCSQPYRIDRVGLLYVGFPGSRVALAIEVPLPAPAPARTVAVAWWWRLRPRLPRTLPRIIVGYRVKVDAMFWYPLGAVLLAAEDRLGKETVIERRNVLMMSALEAAIAAFVVSLFYESDAMVPLLVMIAMVHVLRYLARRAKAFFAPRLAAFVAAARS